MAESTTFGRFVWYDLMTPDTDASNRFYTAALGWGVTTERPLMGIEGRPPYVMFTAAGTPIAGLVPLNEEYWLGYVQVPDVDSSVTQATDLGAEVLFGPHEIANVGRFVVIADPQGAAIALFQTAARSSRSTPYAPKTLEFSWHELATADWRAALAFYSAMFGWETITERDMGPRGIYVVFGQNGVAYGGMFNKPPEMPAPAWCYYVRVHSVREAAEKVLQNGGDIIIGPREVPGGDWIAQCRTPSGGVFAVHQLPT